MEAEAEVVMTAMISLCWTLMAAFCTVTWHPPLSCSSGAVFSRLLLFFCIKIFSQFAIPHVLVFMLNRSEWMSTVVSAVHNGWCHQAGVYGETVTDEGSAIDTWKLQKSLVQIDFTVSLLLRWSAWGTCDKWLNLRLCWRDICELIASDIWYYLLKCVSV